jgi:ATP-dependent helicase/nuclease subunit A
MNKAAPPDAAARQRIVFELDRNLLVEAGAGSGKTHELAARMAAGVAGGVYEIERLAAVTFTRKAAAELRGRFHAALEAELRNVGRFVGAGPARRSVTPADVVEAPAGLGAAAAARGMRLQHALSNLERFFAGTIHAFCARLLRERPIDAGVSPGFTELDDVEEALLRQQTWRDYRAQAKAAGDADLVALLDANLGARQLDDAFETVCLYEDVTFPPGDAAMPDAAPVWPRLEAFWREIERRLPEPMDPESKCKTQERARAFSRAWRAAARGDRSPALLADLLRMWEPKPNVTGKWWAAGPADGPRLKREVEALHAEFRDDVVLPFLQLWRQHLYAHAVALLTKARAAAAAERRRRNALSFNDLLLVTARVLRTNAVVRRALQQKYRWLFVDEFQDTDPIQAEIMFLLAADEAPGPGPRGPGPDADWRRVALRPGALFVVGDPKQSIYRFRRADIDIYNDVRARLAGPDGRGLVQLTTNFRSTPALCAWANRVFATRFPGTPTPHAPAFAPLDAFRGAPAPPAVAVLDFDPDLEPRDAGRDEAARIARYIRAEVDAGRRSFGDFLILTRRKKGLRPYAEALEGLHVPIEVTGAGAFGESAEVRHLALLLAALADPQDAVALVGVLRGPLFGLSDRQLFTHRHAGGWLGIFSEAAPEAPVGRALAQLRRWHGWTRRLPAGAALERILDDSGYLALAAATPGGVDAGDLLHAIDRVRVVVASGFTLAEAAEALAGWSGLDEDGPGESTEVDSLPLEPGRRDVVRLMNLHKAKGLEADVVFLADPLGGFDPRADVRVLRSGADAIGYFPVVDGRGYAAKVLAQPAGWEQHRADELAYLDAEVDRLLYVAATRARDLLVIGRWPGKTGGRTAAWSAFTPFLADAPRLVEPKTVEPHDGASVDLSSSALASARAAIGARHDRAREPSWSAAPVTSEAKRLPRLTREPAEAQDDDPTRALVAETASRRADAGAAWGTLVHGLLEHAMRHPAASPDDLHRLALWLTLEAPQLRPLVDHALDTVAALARGGFWQAAQASAERWEEAPFAVLEAAGAQPGPACAPPNILTGTIDLVYRDGDAWRIVDYKTDADAAAVDLDQRHRAQLAAYERAWQGISGAPATARVVGARQGPRRGSGR